METAAAASSGVSDPTPWLNDLMLLQRAALIPPSMKLQVCCGKKGMKEEGRVGSRRGCELHTSLRSINQNGHNGELPDTA